MKYKIPKDYIDSLESPRKEEILKIHEFIQKMKPELKPFILQSSGSVFIGYGKVHYKTKSGCEGDWFRIGLSSRATGISVYIGCDAEDQKLVEKYKSKLKANCGKACIRFKKFEDVDFEVLGELLAEVINS